MTEERSEDTQTLLASMSLRRLLLILLLGAGVGSIVWGLNYVLDTYVLQAAFCRDGQTTCSEVSQYSEALASIAAAGVALFGLVKLRAMRPLVVVVATTLALWGLLGVVGSLQWQVAMVAVAGLYAVVYAVFAWIARLRVLWIVMFLTVAVLVAIRLSLRG
jgi:hypothetical protein